MQVNNNVHRSLVGLQQKDKMTTVKNSTKTEDQLIEFEQALMSMEICHEMK